MNPKERIIRAIERTRARLLLAIEAVEGDNYTGAASEIGEATKTLRQLVTDLRGLD